MCIGKEEERDYPIFCALYCGARICELGDADDDTKAENVEEN